MKTRREFFRLAALPAVATLPNVVALGAAAAAVSVVPAIREAPVRNVYAGDICRAADWNNMADTVNRLTAVVNRMNGHSA